MPRQKQTKGKCIFCGAEYAKVGMTKHLSTCAKRKEAMQEVLGAVKSKVKAQSMPIYHIQVEGAYATMYWMHLDVPGEFTLRDLDQFLRDVWLECCGHLSVFRISGADYQFHVFERGQRNMNAKLRDILQPGMQFGHEYDFGTTTELTLKVIGVREGQATGNVLQIMAQNEPPSIQCDFCEEQATELCVQCVYDDQGLVCEKHKNMHPCGEEEMLLPLVNSPRAGECGYTGPEGVSKLVLQR
jgi:hypothetical protein